ncbi:MAG: hypothetical protein M0Z94_08555 [Dehalococcoidales bacterium]|nr:hypothetical protein [Dehalococcoidales bacterium]
MRATLGAEVDRFEHIVVVVSLDHQVILITHRNGEALQRLERKFDMWWME